jgi:hypothetical protein
MVIFLIAIFLIVLTKFATFEKSAKFMFIPVLTFCFIGQVSERKCKK